MTTKQQWLESIMAAIHWKQLHEYGAMAAEQRLMETWVIRNPPMPAPAPVLQRHTATQISRLKNTLQLHI